MVSGSKHRSVVVRSAPAAAEKVYRQILSEAQVNDYSQDDIFAIHLALEEAFLNAIQHGNKQDPNKEVEIGYLVTPEKVEISVADQGSGFDADNLPDPRCGENLYRTSGRGVFLMRYYMNSVEYNPTGNCVHMVRYKKGSDLSEPKAKCKS